MIPPRLIPVLLIDGDRRVVKTVRFGARTYIGDPFNIIRLFNEKEVDEICVLDIDASAQGKEPDFKFIASLASECFMPMSYGGAVSNIGHARRLIADGIEKVILRTHASDSLIGEISAEFGRQAVIGCVDYQMSEGQFLTLHERKSAADIIKRLANAGAGELILQAVDLDGTRSGMDLQAIETLTRGLQVPVIALGGAADPYHMHEAIRSGADAAASGSAFSFIGRLRAVLVTYPEYADRQKACAQC